MRKSLRIAVAAVAGLTATAGAFARQLDGFQGPDAFRALLLQDMKEMDKYKAKPVLQAQ
jgi:hypothetical protein